jgi:hypothetical protein
MTIPTAQPDATRAALAAAIIGPLADLAAAREYAAGHPDACPAIVPGVTHCPACGMSARVESRCASAWHDTHNIDAFGRPRCACGNSIDVNDIADGASACEWCRDVAAALAAQTAPHTFARSVLAGVTTCSTCGLLPCDDADAATDCPAAL